jgi:hypothetical protein
MMPPIAGHLVPLGCLPRLESAFQLLDRLVGLLKVAPIRKPELSSPRDREFLRIRADADSGLTA